MIRPEGILRAWMATTNKKKCEMILFNIFCFKILHEIVYFSKKIVEKTKKKNNLK